MNESRKAMKCFRLEIPQIFHHVHRTYEILHMYIDNKRLLAMFVYVKASRPGPNATQ